MATYVMGDIHGRLVTFISMLDKIKFDKEKDTLYLLGDYTDSGPDGVGVIQHIMNMQAQGFRVHCLMGNHDKMMLDVVDYQGDSDEEYQDNIDDWYINYGENTHEVFNGLSTKEQVQIIDWLRNLKLTYQITVGGKEYILCHALPWFENTDIYYSLNARFEPITLSRAIYEDNPNVTVICGHTIVANFKSLDQDGKCKIYKYGPNLIYIDCGAKALGSRKYARLGCLRLDDMAEFYT